MEPVTTPMDTADKKLGCASAALPAGVSAVMTLTLGGAYVALCKRRDD